MGNMWGGGSSGPVNMNSEEAEFIRSEISNHCVVVFSKTYCPYCVNTKKILAGLNVNVRLIELNQRPGGPSLQDVLCEMTGARTVPRVFINGKCIGGDSETRALNRSGKLAAMVKDCTN